VNTGEVLNTLVQQTVLLVKQNKHFRSLTVDDQAELCQANVLVTIVLSCTSLYTAKNSSLTWPGLPPVTFSLASLQPLLDPDLKDEVARLTKFFDSFSKLELPRSAANLLVLVAVFNSEFCVLEDTEAVAEARLKYFHLLYECLCQSVGIRKCATPTVTWWTPVRIQRGTEETREARMGIGKCSACTVSRTIILRTARRWTRRGLVVTLATPTASSTGATSADPTTTYRRSVSTPSQPWPGAGGGASTAARTTTGMRRTAWPRITWCGTISAPGHGCENSKEVTVNKLHFKRI